MKRNKKYKTFLSAIMTAFICMAGGITVFAYQPPSTITNKSTEVADTTDIFIRKKPTVPPKMVSDYFAVSNDGTVYNLCYTDKNDKATCIHNYSVQVEATKHIKNSNGDVL